MLGRLLWLAGLQVQHGRVVPDRDVVGPHDDLCFEADDGLRGHLAVGGVEEARAIRFGACEQLHPDVTHLVGRPEAPHDALRRHVGVARVVGGVVVHVLEANDGAGGHPKRLRVAVLVLPLEIPLADDDEPTSGAVRQIGPAAHLARA